MNKITLKKYLLSQIKKVNDKIDKKIIAGKNFAKLAILHSHLVQQYESL